MSLFDIPGTENQIKELQSKMEDTTFWNDTQNSSKILSKLKSLQNKVEKFKNIQSELNNLMDLNQLLLED